jgi:hypothetical protein
MFLQADPDRSVGTVYASSSFRVTDNPDYSDTEIHKLSKVVNTTSSASASPTTLMLSERIGHRKLGWGVNWALVRLHDTRTMSTLIPS